MSDSGPASSSPAEGPAAEGDIPQRSPESGPSAARSRASWPLLAGAFVAIVALVCTVLLVRRDGDEAGKPADAPVKPPRALALVRGGAGGAEKADAAMSTSAMPYFGEIEYKLQGTLPDLGKAAPVYQVVATSVTAADVSRLASALGINATPQESQGMWIASDGSTTLTVSSGGGMWSVSYGRYAAGVDAGQTKPGHAGGADGSAPTDGSVSPDGSVSSDGSVATGGSSGSGTAGVDETRPHGPVDVTEPAFAPDQPIDPGLDIEPMPVPAPYEPPVVEAPKNLPSPADAERIARDLLTKMGVTGDWKVEVTDGGAVGYAVSCAANTECPQATTTSVVTSRNVTFHRVVDGIATVGLEWMVELGDNAVVLNLNGVLATLEKVSDYPLRSTQDVYNDLVNGTGFGGGGPVPMGLADHGGVITEPNAVTRAPAPAGPAGDPSGNTSSGSSGGGGTSGDGTTTETVIADPTLPICDGGTPCQSIPPGVPPRPPETVTTFPGTVVIEPMPYPEPIPAPMPEPLPEPLPEPDPIVITITGAERGLMVVPAFEGGTMVTYLVPSYRFLGTHADGGAFQTELVAIERSFLAEPQYPTPTPSDKGREPLPDPMPEPKPEPLPDPTPEPTPEPMPPVSIAEGRPTDG